MNQAVTFENTGGLGPLQIFSPPGKLSLTPASYMAVEAIGTHRDLLAGVGIDWGSGSGCLAVAAAKISAVDGIVGLELAEEDLRVARENARVNGVSDKVTFLHADSYDPYPGENRAALDAIQGRTTFLIANPPASHGDDGLGWRRRVLEGARRFLVGGAPVLMQISYQYGRLRIQRLTDDVHGFTYEGVLAGSDWVVFDQERDDLSRQLVEYVAEEARGGLPYAFPTPGAPDSGHVTAGEALEHFRRTGESPLSKWQLHLFRRR